MDSTETRQAVPGDILDFLREKGRGNFVIRTIDWWGPLRFRVRAAAALFCGIFSLSEFPRLILPTARRPQDLDQRFANYINSETQKAISPFINADGSVDVFGKPFFAPFKNYYEMVSLLNEVVILDQYHTHTLLKEDSIVIDAGANIGAFSVLAAQLAPRGHVYAYEPSAATSEVLKMNARLYGNVTCLHSGLGDIEGEKDILVHEATTGGNVFIDSPLAAEFRRIYKVHPEKASMTTIDAFVVGQKIPQVDFIKMDTEGYEAKILQGARETIKRYKPIIAMSAYHNPDDKVELPKLLKSICPEYVCDLYEESEEDLVCSVPKKDV